MQCRPDAYIHNKYFNNRLNQTQYFTLTGKKPNLSITSFRIRMLYIYTEETEVRLQMHKGYGKGSIYSGFKCGMLKCCNKKYNKESPASLEYMGGEISKGRGKTTDPNRTSIK